MRPIAKAISAQPCTSIEGLRVKALVAFWEIAPLAAGDTHFHFGDEFPFQQLFSDVAELCGLGGKIAATGYAMPELYAYEYDYDGDDEDGEA